MYKRQATNDQIKIIDLIHALGAADKKKWTELTLKDAVKNVLVKYNATTIAAEETIAETCLLYTSRCV